MNTIKLGLGCGGFSRIGMRKADRSTEESLYRSAKNNAINVVRTAYKSGLRFFDTAEAYGTESLLGEALSPYDRKDLTLCSKLSCFTDGILKTPEQVRSSLEKSLANLKTDYLDIYYCHGIGEDEYEQVVSGILPVLNEAKEQGLIKSIGVSEMFGQDRNHAMLARAVEDEHWDAVMVGYNIMNQSGGELLKKAGEKGIFRVNMFAVRQALINNEVFGIYVDRMINEGKLHFTHTDFYEFKDELFRGLDAVSLPGLAYRFVRDENLFDMILSGTGKIEHLKDNVSAMEGDPLSDRVRHLIREFFDGEDDTSGQEGFR